MAPRGQLSVYSHSPCSTFHITKLTKTGKHAVHSSSIQCDISTVSLLIQYEWLKNKLRSQTDGCITLRICAKLNEQTESPSLANPCNKCVLNMTCIKNIVTIKHLYFKDTTNRSNRLDQQTDSMLLLHKQNLVCAHWLYCPKRSLLWINH